MEWIMLLLELNRLWFLDGIEWDAVTCQYSSKHDLKVMAKGGHVLPSWHFFDKKFWIVIMNQEFHTCIDTTKYVWKDLHVKSYYSQWTIQTIYHEM